MSHQHMAKISGKKLGQRLDSRVLEEEIQKVVALGYRHLHVNAYGQHGIGGRLWRKDQDSIHVTIEGHPGQRVGAFGFPNTFIEVKGPVSDDVGWLNAGARIAVLGNAANGAANGMAQGEIYIGGNIGARGMTMTKHNPRFDPPELWVLGSAGDYFGEFMAGGISVICGHEAQNPDNVIGYRPLVGMVGGKVFFRGPHAGYSQVDAKLVPLSDEDWQWLRTNLQRFLKRINRSELFETLSDRSEWQLLTARTPQERAGRRLRSMQSFHRERWDRELGPGGLIGDLTDLDRSPIPLITTGELRRFVPVWENRLYAAPCEASCPTGIPVQERWRLIREGRVDEAVDLALAYTPFPASVCGYLCPNLCMQACTRRSAAMPAVDITRLGRASVDAKLPELPPLKGSRIAVIGGGPAGISVAWQLRQKGLDAVVYDMSAELGGKMTAAIPDSRLPKEIVGQELERIRKVLPHVHLQQKLNQAEFDQLREDFDFIVIAVGAQKPRRLPVPGGERMITALEFLRQAKTDTVKPGRRVVIIGAGNVGCDAATEAHRLGAEDITLIDIQEPASFGKERADAEAAGAKFLWPRFTKRITAKGVELTSGELLAAETVIISIGDEPDLDFLPPDVAVEKGFIRTNEYNQTSDARIFAIGDAARPGLLTDAIGSGRKVALAISEMAEGKRPLGDTRRMIDRRRIHLEYFDPRITEFEDTAHCGSQCSSCGACRDCGICIAVCPYSAISRVVLDGDDYEYVVDENRCIGCGFCAGACPCGIWNLVENTPLG
jgi:NADPH-dependent glutamate synthase beta subunit-like oxidoreductase/glutamate synthase domain-containing protein 3/NAD-dependent dihydropyrimidine dehydrogenase PreA subunit